MTTKCVFCKTPDGKYTCCLNRGCKICEKCYNELFIDTKYGFAPRSSQFNWLNCAECQKEIVDITWIDQKGHLRYQMSSYRFVNNMYSYFNGNAGIKYSS